MAAHIGEVTTSKYLQVIVKITNNTDNFPVNVYYKRLARYALSLALRGQLIHSKPRQIKSPEEYRSTRALHVMLVNHLSHHIMYVRQTVPARRSCGDEHHCPLMTALNALLRRWC